MTTASADPSGAEKPEPAPPKTVVHVVRHGEVDNPTNVLYGRLPGFHLSDLGRKMADRVAENFAGRDVVAVTASPLERAQETATPIAAQFNLDIGTDDRLIEAASKFQGERFGGGDGVLKKVLAQPSFVRHLVNPFKPSWGEPYAEIVQRMSAGLDAARELGRGHEVVLVSHQLPIWVLRLANENRRLWHDPRKRQCTLASVTSYTFTGDRLVSIAYTEPARDLLPLKTTKKFVAGA